MHRILNIKGKGRLSAETIVTARITVTFHLEGEDEPITISAQMTAPASDMELFLIQYTHNEDTEVDIHILDTYTPLIQKHDDNLHWLDNLQQLHQGKEHISLIHNRETDNEKE